MQKYTVSYEYYFKEIGQKVKAGGTVELREGDAQVYMTSVPGLLSPARITVEGVPFLIRKMDGAEETTQAQTEVAPPAETATQPAPPATEEAPVLEAPPEAV